MLIKRRPDDLPVELPVSATKRWNCERLYAPVKIVVGQVTQWVDPTLWTEEWIEKMALPNWWVDPATPGVAG